MELIISSPMHKKKHDIAWVELISSVGNMIIQSNHAPMVMRLEKKSQVVYGLTSGKQESLTVEFGVAHITRESVLLLLIDK